MIQENFVIDKKGREIAVHLILKPGFLPIRAIDQKFECDELY
jgi:hypothetical protein